MIVVCCQFLLLSSTKRIGRLGSTRINGSSLKEYTAPLCNQTIKSFSVRRGSLRDRTRKFRHFLNRNRKNWIYFGVFRNNWNGNWKSYPLRTPLQEQVSSFHSGITSGMKINPKNGTKVAVYFTTPLPPLLIVIM